MTSAPGVEERVPSSTINGCVTTFSIRSELLSEFSGAEIEMHASVVLPPGYNADKEWVFCYNIAGFGGKYDRGFEHAKDLLPAMLGDQRPRMIYVFLDGRCPRGHHAYADSANNGPWGSALTEEFIPALEAAFSSAPSAERRFLTGHSSGGWSSLWLQVEYPDMFNGVWSTGPDPVDFRDFVGINIYEWDNVFVDLDGNETQLERRGGEWALTVREFVTSQAESQPLDGQWASLEAVFSPRDASGKPAHMHDWKTGKIDPDVVKHWAKYDISRKIRNEWKENRRLLDGKIHIYVGEIDTVRLEGAVKLIGRELEALGADADIRIIPGRDHSDLFAPEGDNWPKGMLHEIYRQMWERHLGS